MNTGPDRHPLTDEEAALAARLRALPGGEPSPALDARVRARAHAAAVAARPEKRPWVWGISTAAVAVLAVGLLWRSGLPPMHEELPVNGGSEPQAVELQFTEPAAGDADGAEALPAGTLDAAAGDAGTNATAERQAASAAPADASLPRTETDGRRLAPVEDRAVQAHKASTPPPPAPPAPPAPQAFEPLPAPAPAAPVVQDPTPMAIPAPPPAPRAAPEPTRLRREAQVPEERPSAASPREAEALEDRAGSAPPRQSLGAARARADHALAAAIAEAATLAPEEWLQRIQALHADGRDAEARAHLRAFRERHPDHPIPADLAILQ